MSKAVSTTACLSLRCDHPSYPRISPLCEWRGPSWIVQAGSLNSSLSLTFYALTPDLPADSIASPFKTCPDARHDSTCLSSQHLGGRDRRIAHKFKASLCYTTSFRSLMAPEYGPLSKSKTNQINSNKTVQKLAASSIATLTPFLWCSSKLCSCS